MAFKSLMKRTPAAEIDYLHSEITRLESRNDFIEGNNCLLRHLHRASLVEIAALQGVITALQERLTSLEIDHDWLQNCFFELEVANKPE
jgi:hypothetical protein